jgi:hypothetical protein
MHHKNDFPKQNKQSITMRVVFLIIVALHALVHLLGFVKGFGFGELKELTLAISKPMGLLWLTSAVLFLIYGILYFSNSRYTWLVGFVAVVVSQLLVLMFWKDAKYGTIPNVAILAVSIVSFGFYNFQKLVQLETEQILGQSKTPKEHLVAEQDIRDLPEPVKNWLRSSGVIGKPYIFVGKVSQQAKMKLKPEQKNWMGATATQYTTIDNPAFIWTTVVKMNGLLNFQGRDKFVGGKGEMLIKLNSVLNVVNEQGEKMDEGSMQRYLGEMVWFPSLALSPHISWETIDSTAAKATMKYEGVKGSGTFYFNSNGDFIKFSALRFMGNEKDAVKREWVLLVDDYKVFEGIKVPAKMRATWKLEEGDWTWLQLEIIDITYNETAH